MNRCYDKYLLLLMFLYNFFVPGFYNILRSRELAIVNGGIIIFGTCLILFKKLRICFMSQFEKEMYLSFFLIFVLYLICIGLSSIVNNFGELAIEDFFDYHRPLLLFVSFTIPF